MRSKSDPSPPIRVRGARAHNLKRIDLDIPHHQLVVITGVSGSGKSSLAFDTVCVEGQRRYLESFSTRARSLLGKLGRAEADSLENLGPAIAVDQKTAVRNPRSTVGTLSELYDHLRLLYARLGERPSAADGDDAPPLSRGLFSFNGPGACPACRGLGVEDAIDPELLIADPARTLREGALKITTDSGYIIYSQVTMEVLDRVCRAHGFSVDIPWRDLTAEQRRVVLEGSDRIKIPYGKHTLESRLKWSGITARPREEGHYHGIVPVMAQILQRDRNRNILRFARTGPCTACAGTRLSDAARAVLFRGRTIAGTAAMTIAELDRFCRGLEFDQREAPAGEDIRAAVLRRTGLLADLGLDYLTLDRGAPTLSGGEAQRIRLASIVGAGLRGVTYVLDEPSVGLHPRDNDRLLKILRRLVDQGNSVLVVEHDRRTMLAADRLIDIGPGAGDGGGRVLFNGPPADLLADTGDPGLAAAPTRICLREGTPVSDRTPRAGAGPLSLRGATRHNLHGLDVDFRLGALNVVTGVSGAGKSSLLEELIAAVENGAAPGADRIRRLITVDQSPIGRTPRSNPATYTGLFDAVRATFAAEPGAIARGLGKGSFSFNNKGGRCETCQGAGVEKIGMHFLGDVEIPCPDCRGRRFGPEVLAVEHRGKNIHQVLEMSIAAAARFFADSPKMAPMLDALVDLGLGYVALGQRSTTLSGGEAQRVKLAAELGRPRGRGALYVLDEPTTGLHAADVSLLLRALDRLVEAGNTVVVTEHDPDLIAAADHVIDLGPESGDAGGRLLYAGEPQGLARVADSATGRALTEARAGASLAAGTGAGAAPDAGAEPPVDPDAPIRLRGVRTHNLRGVDVDIPVGRITAVTGVSGSGKTSLAFDTLFAEGRARYAENFSTYVRQQLTGRDRPDLESCAGLMPAIAVGRGSAAPGPRSTVATSIGIHPLLRLMMSRAGEGFAGGERPLSSLFSFNGHQGACPECRGLGVRTVCDPRKLITHPERSLLDGALDGHKTGRYYGETDGRYVATLRKAGEELGIDFSRPWRELDDRARGIAFRGAGEREFDVVWRYKRGARKGKHLLTTPWVGFSALVEEEYSRKHADRRGEAMRAVMTDIRCSACGGLRLRPEALAVRVAGRSIADFCAMDIEGAADFFAAPGDESVVRLDQLRAEILLRLEALRDVGLEHLTLDRPTATLSGGEARRLQLARQLGAKLRGVVYVLDEPTLGLHPRDIRRLWTVIERLRDRGNTVVVVDHAPEVVLGADHVVDMGPGAGRLGGAVIAVGAPADIMESADSLTGGYLRSMRERGEIDESGALAEESAPPGSSRAASAESGAPALSIRGAHLHNLKNLDADLPVTGLTAVTGVSGSGKSSLIFGVIAASAAGGRPEGCTSITGLDAFAAVVPIRRGAAGAAGGGMPATATGVLDHIRKKMAALPEARAAKLTARHFSPNQKGGRCEECNGAGVVRVSMDFLADVQAVCPACRGRRFVPEVLACRLDGRSIADILQTDVAAAADLFADDPKIAGPLRLLDEIGLGYLQIGQSTGSLSGGERQRLHLAAELAAAGKGRKLFLLDEPAAGLHYADVERLGDLLRRLVDAGHAVIAAVHDRGIVRRADRVLELGPGGGARGGRIVGLG